MNERELRGLFQAALDALRAEDESLKACFFDGEKQRHPTGRGAPGLTYWLFETTLVYFIFKAWLPKVHDVWEHVLEANSKLRPEPYSQGRKGAHEKCDLAILDAAGIVQAAFEAKWWNNSTSRTQNSLRADASKLRRAFPDGGVEKYLLTFWWGTDTFKKDVEEARAFCKKEALTLVVGDKFDTVLSDEKKGYFALGLLRVTQVT